MKSSFRDAMALPQVERQATFRFQPDEFVRDENDNRTIEMSISSEREAEQWFGTEILEHTDRAIDLEFIGGGTAPLLLDHDRRRQIGVIERAWLDSKTKKLRARVRFSRGSTGQEILDDVVDGIRGNVSIGYRILKTVTDEKSETVTVTRWSPFEASFVSVPADPSVGVGRMSNTKSSQEASMDPEEIEGAGSGLPAAPTESTRQVQAPNGGTREVTYSQRDLEEAAASRNVENAEISALGAMHNMSDVAREFIRDGRTLAEFTGYVRENIPEERPLRNADIGLTPRETRQFSVLNLALAGHPGATSAQRDRARFEMEAVEAADDADTSGTRARGIRMPAEVLRNWVVPGSTMHREMEGRRVLLAGTDTDLVPTEHWGTSFIDVLRNQSSVMRAGPTMLQGLSGNVDIPKKATASAATWISAEDVASTVDEPTFTSVSLTPKDISVNTIMSRRIRQQASPDIEMLVRMDIAQAIALGIDLGALEGSGAAGQPTGVLNTTGLTKVATFAAVNPTFAEAVSLETAVANSNALVGNMSYIGRTNMRGALKTTAKDAGSGIMVLENDMLNGYSYLASNQGTDGNLYFGNWSDCLIGMWGTLDLNFDYAFRAAEGGLRLIAFQTIDVAVRHIESFAYGNDTV